MNKRQNKKYLKKNGITKYNDVVFLYQIKGKYLGLRPNPFGKLFDDIFYDAIVGNYKDKIIYP